MAAHEQLEERGDAPVGHAAAEHPGPRQYVIVAIILAVVTGLEIGLFYVKGIPNGILVAALIVLMIIKFALVALWFMHLRFDSRVYRRLFVTGIILAISVFVVVLLTFCVFTG